MRVRTGQVAKILGVNPGLVRQIVTSGEVSPPPLRDRAGMWRFDETDIERIKAIVYPPERQVQTKRARR